MPDPSDSRREPNVSDNYPAVSESSGLKTAEEPEDVFVVLTQAFDGHGTSLIRPDSPQFDGFPGVTVYVELPDGRGGDVTLSPIHGDPRKAGFTAIRDGEVCRVLDRQGGRELEADGRCTCGGLYHRIYLSPRLDHGEVVLVCNVWGCHRSRIVDDSDLLSWVEY